MAYRKPLIVMIAALAFGAARLPFEAALTRDLRAEGLLYEPLDISTRDKFDQASSAAALGGLRTLVATFWSLKAFGYFTEQRWADVADTYDSIVDLAPHTRYYWESGSWHQAYNAASYYINHSTLPPLRRRESWRSSVKTGREFLERGIRNNPDDWRLRMQLGMLLVDANKFPAFSNLDDVFISAAEAFRSADEIGNAAPYVPRFQLYALARVEGREAEALELAQELYHEGKHNRTPTLLVLLLVLEAKADTELDTTGRSIELFGSPEKAYDVLSSYWIRTRERYPVTGMAEALKGLETRLGIPEANSVLNRPLAPPSGPRDWFES